MTGIWTKENQEWWNKPENRFVFNFNQIFTGPNWELFEIRNKENVGKREEILKKVFEKSLAGEGFNSYKDNLLDEVTTKLHQAMIKGGKLNYLKIREILDSFREATNES
jgi:hypothetical protein